MTRGLSCAAAIAGIGATEFSKTSSRSEYQLTCDTVLIAVDDAGIGVEGVDEVSLFNMESNPEIAVARSLGIPELWGRQIAFLPGGSGQIGDALDEGASIGSPE